MVLDDKTNFQNKGDYFLDDNISDISISVSFDGILTV